MGIRIDETGGDSWTITVDGGQSVKVTYYQARCLREAIQRKILTLSSLEKKIRANWRAIKNNNYRLKTPTGGRCASIQKDIGSDLYGIHFGKDEIILTKEDYIRVLHPSEQQAAQNLWDAAFTLAAKSQPPAI